MRLYELMKVMKDDQRICIGQLEDDGEQWEGTFNKWFADGTPMSFLQVVQVCYIGSNRIFIEVW